MHIEKASIKQTTTHDWRRWIAVSHVADAKALFISQQSHESTVLEFRK